MKHMNTRAPLDGGNCPMFRSYHDYRLGFAELIGRSRAKDARAAFNDFKRELEGDLGWRERFDGRQVIAIENALRNNEPIIYGFTWHHHQDANGEVMQLVDRSIHQSTHHSGGWCISQQENYEMEPRPPSTA
jgi:hypothetical protein